MNYGTRKYRFEIARQVIKKDQIEYHGRNCVLHVQIVGEKDPRSHMIMDLGDMDTIVNRILSDYDHTTIDYSFESLAKILFSRLKLELPLNKVILYEDDNTFYTRCKYNSGDNMKVTKCYDFTAAHRTHNPELSDEENLKLYGKCNTLHGHQYRLEVTLGSNVRKRGVPQPVDLDRVDKMVNNVLTGYDKTILNENNWIRDNNATTENVIEAIWDEIGAEFNEVDYFLSQIRLHETDRNYFDYYGPPPLR